jgi:3-oxoacyl-[acyl-carrier protein] reductase
MPAERGFRLWRNAVDLGLRDSVAVVVGGASGIGNAIAAAFVAEGANVAVMDLRAVDGFTSFIADVTDYAAVATSRCW